MNSRALSVAVLGLGLMVLLVPGMPNGATAPRWALAAVGAALLAFSAFPRVPWRVQGPAWAFTGWMALACCWAPIGVDAAMAVALWLILMLGFFVGAAITDLRPLWLTLAIGTAINAIIVVLQHPSFIGWEGIPQMGAPSGLFGNRNPLAWMAALTLLGSITIRVWWGAVASLIVLGVVSSRAAILAAGAGVLVMLWRRSRAAAVVLGLSAAVIAGAATLDRSYSTNERAALLLDTIGGLTLLGHGAGAFYSTFPPYALRFDAMDTRPIHTHSDFLEVAYDYGVVGFVLFVGLGLAIWISTRDRAYLAAALVLMALDSPLHWPASGLLLALLAGHGACRDDGVRHGVADV